MAQMDKVTLKRRSDAALSQKQWPKKSTRRSTPTTRPTTVGTATKTTNSGTGAMNRGLMPRRHIDSGVIITAIDRLKRKGAMTPAAILSRQEMFLTLRLWARTTHTA